MELISSSAVVHFLLKLICDLLLQASRVDGANTLGPWGGSGGTAWSFENAQTITKIKISVGDVVDSITFQYMDGETARWSPRYGGAGGKPTEVLFTLR